jgi:hypothetical protein
VLKRFIDAVRAGFWTSPLGEFIRPPVVRDVHERCPVCGSEDLCLFMSPCGEGF